MKLSKELIVNELKSVLYFPKGTDIITLNMVKDIRSEENFVHLVIALPKEDKKGEAALQTLCGNALKQVNPEVQVSMQFIREYPSLEKVKYIVAVGSGKGGVGKSTVAANLAMALHKTGNKVGILDADIYGPSIPIMFDVADRKPTVAPDEEGGPKIIPVENYGIKIQSIAFFVDPEQALIWRGPMASNALNQLINDTVWGELDFLIIDLPPGTGDIHLTMVQQYPIDGIAIVSTPQQVALADARKAFSMFNTENIRVPILGLVENMSYFSPPENPDRKYYLFGKQGGRKLAEDARVNLLAEIPIVESICESGDNGRPVALDENSPVYKAFINLAVNIQALVEKKNKQ